MGDYYESVIVNALVCMFLSDDSSHGFTIVLYIDIYLADCFIQKDLYPVLGKVTFKVMFYNIALIWKK